MIRMNLTNSVKKHFWTFEEKYSKIIRFAKHAFYFLVLLFSLGGINAVQ